jgi:hypothetical protein
MKWILSEARLYSQCVRSDDKHLKQRLRRPIFGTCIEFLRADVRTQTTAIIGETINLNAEQTTKFWPIYREYDAALQPLNDNKLADILEYTKSYDSITDKKAERKRRTKYRTIWNGSPLIVYLGRPSQEYCHATDTLWRLLPYRV